MTAWACATAVAVSLAAAPAGPPDAPERDADAALDFSRWSELAAAQTRSPAQAESGDLVREWVGPNGRTVRLVVKRPRPAARAPTVTVAPPPPGADARPAFEAALHEARRLAAARLVIPPGTYTFARPPRGARGHLLLQDLRDLSVEGPGATLVFAGTEDGLVINRCRRVALHGLTLAYAARTASLAVSERTLEGTVLRVDRDHPVGPDDAVFYVSEFDPTARAWVPAGRRVILPPRHADSARLVAPQIYRSPAFDPLPPGRSFVLFHHWYGGNAIKIDDTRGPDQAEDIVLERLTIRSAHGMGVLVYGLKRGFALIDSEIAPLVDGPSPVGTEYDAVHVLHGGGDVLLAGNRLRASGDDAISLNSPVHPVTRVDAARRVVQLTKYSRFIEAGDRLAFFDDEGRPLGLARVRGRPRPLGGLDHEVELDHVPADLRPGASARDLELVASRFEVSRNTIEDCNCHGLLAQIPNGRVVGNAFRRLNRNAIRLLADVSRWKEGIGALNVSVDDNTIVDTAADEIPGVAWGAITAYGGGRAGSTDAPVNRWLRIRGNTIRAAMQGCIGVMSSRDVEVTDNSCEDTNRRRPGTPSVVVRQSGGVRLSGNQRGGRTTGGVEVEAESEASRAR